VKGKKLKLKQDRYRRARGGYARFLDVYCSKCSKKLFVYQKDGPGALKRIYIDRISDSNLSLKTKGLKCKKCDSLLGTRYVYKKENRPAFRLYQDAVSKSLK
tara:strand:- start:90 stop:395 length:306 start_codon:yes stop_codon:yes gene_type:complete